MKSPFEPLIAWELEKIRQDAERAELFLTRPDPWRYVRPATMRRVPVVNRGYDPYNYIGRNSGGSNA